MAITPGRLISDATFSNSTALPSGAGTSLSAAFDLQGATLDANSTFPENVTLEVVVPADTALVSAAVRNYDLMADSVSTPTAAVAGYRAVVTGTAGNGAAVTLRWRLPANIARYIAVRATGGSSGSGDSTALSYTTKLLF
jgi:hypothetical protein